MQILIVTDSYSTGGSVTYIKNIVHSLYQQGHQVRMISFGMYDFPNFETHKNLNRHHYYIDKHYRLSSIFQRLKYLYNGLKHDIQQYDLVLSDLVLPCLTFQIVRILIPKFKSIPLIYQFHGSWAMEIRSNEKFFKVKNSDRLYLSRKFVENYVLSHVNKIIVFSKYSQKLIKTYFSLDTTIVPPGVDYLFPDQIRQISKTQARSEVGLDPDGYFVLLANRIESRKGMSDILPHLKNLDPKIKVIISSNFNQVFFEFFKLHSNADLGAKTIIFNTPSRHELALLYRSADITIMPSIDLETFGFVTLESFYYHTPVVAFDIGANSEIIPKESVIKNNKNKWSNLIKFINQSHRNQLLPQFNQNINFSWDSYIKYLISSCQQS